MNIIFLDIDGVLNSLPYIDSFEKDYDEICEDNLKILAEVYHKSKANIVLSSTWRTLRPELDEDNELYNYLMNSLKKYDMEIFSYTPYINMNRPLEIKTWLEGFNCDEDIHYVSLDDDFSYEDYKRYGIGDCLVKTEFYCSNIEDGGLQKKHIPIILNKLGVTEK